MHVKITIENIMSVVLLNYYKIANDTQKCLDELVFAKKKKDYNFMMVIKPMNGYGRSSRVC